MANIKISQLISKGESLAPDDLLEISKSLGGGLYETRSVTGANILSSKQDTLSSGINIKTVEGQNILGSGNIEITKTDIGLANVDNTSDANKPISTATQAALNAKQNTITNSDSITQGSTNLFLTTAERTKLTNTSGTNTGDQTNITGNAATVTTNANLTGVVTSTGNTTAIANGAISNAMLANVAVANLSGTNTGDNATNTQYSSLVSNATHTGDATGNVGLTVKGINGTLLSTLGTGILKNTTGTGVPSIAVAADFPTLNQNTTGNAATVTTNANLTGVVTSTGNTTTIADNALSIAKTSGLQAAIDLKQDLSSKNAANGYAGLDASSKINPSQLPSIAITDTFVVIDQAAQLALTAEVGDVAVRTDLNKSFILKTSPATTFANWQELLTPTDSVSSVFGRTGVVTAQNGDYTASQVGAPSGSGTSTGTNTGDNATNSQYSGLVSNATHTGDATGDVGLTVKGINGTLLSTLGTGILKNTTGTGVPSIAVAADFPTLNQNTTGTAANVTGIVALANGGTGTATPSLVAGTNITVTGTFPNQTITATGTAGAVTQIVAGTNVTISPAGGTGVVTINSSGGGGGGGGFHMLSPTLPGALYLAQAYTPNPGSTSLSNGVNQMMMTLFAPATTFTITELSVNVTTAASSASNVKILVYSDDGFGYPRAKLIESSALSMTTTGAKTFLTSYTFTAGTRYWMGVITDSSAGAIVTALGSNVPYMRHFNYNIMVSGYYINTSFASPIALNTSSFISGNLQTAAVFVRT
jgi:hypothetical protein